MKTSIKLISLIATLILNSPTKAQWTEAKSIYGDNILSTGMNGSRVFAGTAKGVYVVRVSYEEKNYLRKMVIR